MLINLRNALMAGTRLPYDAEVEYLESTGTQWIDTGIVGVSEWHITAQGTATPSASNCVIATKSSGGSFWGAFRGYNYWAVGTAGDSANYRITLPYTSLGAFVVNFNSNSVTFSDGVETATRNSTPNFSVSFYLFSTHNDGYAAKVKIYGCKVYQNSTLVRDFIPVRKGTVGYLYDRVSGKLFGNAGTGDFVLGPDVVPVEYIESHGAEYIDTGIKGSQSLVTTLDYQLTATTRSRSIFGSYENNAKYYLYVSSGGPLQVGSGNDYKNVSVLSDRSRHVVKFSANTVELDGSNIATLGVSAAETAQTLLLFSMHNNSGGVYDGEPCKIFGFKIETNSTPIRDYKAIRVGTDATSWEGAMMDVLTRRIYRNAGTGAFTYGNDLKYPIPAE